MGDEMRLPFSPVIHPWHEEISDDPQLISEFIVKSMHDDRNPLLPIMEDKYAARKNKRVKLLSYSIGLKKDQLDCHGKNYLNDVSSRPIIGQEMEFSLWMMVKNRFLE